MATEEQSVERIYIRDAAEQLNRQMATLRKWEQLGLLPEHLRPHRGHRGWRYWTPDQIDGIRDWLRDTDRRPGKGLPHYNPTEDQLDRALVAMRRPRPKSVIARVNESIDSVSPKKTAARKNPKRG